MSLEVESIWLADKELIVSITAIIGSAYKELIVSITAIIWLTCIGFASIAAIIVANILLKKRDKKNLTKHVKNLLNIQIIEIVTILQTNNESTFRPDRALKHEIRAKFDPQYAIFEPLPTDLYDALINSGKIFDLDKKYQELIYGFYRSVKNGNYRKIYSELDKMNTNKLLSSNSKNPQ